MYTSVYASLFLALIVTSVKYNKVMKVKANHLYKNHFKYMLIFVCILTLGIAIKAYIVKYMLKFEVKAVPTYCVLDLVSVIIYSVLKDDEDCFKCY